MSDKAPPSPGGGDASPRAPQGEQGGQGQGAGDDFVPPTSPFRQPPASPGHYQQPPASPGHNQQPPASPGHYQQPPASPGHYQQPPASPGHYQQPPASPGHNQQPPASPGHNQQPPASPGHGQAAHAGAHALPTDLPSLRAYVHQLETQLQQLAHMNSQLQQTNQQILVSLQSPAAVPYAAPMAAAPLRPHNPAWSEHHAGGQTYYYNSKTGESVWQRPADYNPESAAAAVAAASSSGSVLKGPPGANIFVLRKLRRGEYDEFSDTDLKQAFAAYGTVLRAEMTKDPETGWSRGFGFVSFSSAAEADEAIKHMDGTWLAGKQLKVEKTRSESMV